MQRPALFVLLLSLGAAPLVAQGDPPGGSQSVQQQPAQQQPGQQQPRDLMVAPGSPGQTPEATGGRSTSQAGVPANVCAELVAFFKTKEEQPAKDSTAAAGSQPAQPGAQTAGPGQTAPPMDQVQQRSGLSAPVPKDERTTGATQVTSQQARNLAQGNDLRGCQSAVQQMRRTGVKLPPGLLALAALREDLLAKSQSPAEQKAKP